MEKIFEQGLATMASEQDISKNCQKLFNYLLCLGNNPKNSTVLDERNNRRIFSHREVNLEKIARTIHISVPTIKKYWFILEETGKIRYGGEFNYDSPEEEKKKELLNGREYYSLTEKERLEIWKKLWTFRKKNPSVKYVAFAGSKYRCIPKETIEWINSSTEIDEQAAKIYQFLLGYREVGAKTFGDSVPFTLQDIRDLLNKTDDAKNNKSIMESLFWLQHYKLITLNDDYYLNSKGVRLHSFILTNVEFYPDFKIVDAIEDDSRKITPEVKERINEWIKNHSN